MKRVLPLLLGAPVNGWKTMHLPSWHPQFETPTAVVPGCESSSILFSFSSPRLLCHTSCCCIQHNHCLGPTLLNNFSTAKLPFVNLDSSRTVTSHYWYIQHKSKSPCTLTGLNESCNTKTGTLLFVVAQMMPVEVCKGQREKFRERETTLETKINNIWTNYIQYIVGDPIIWYKILLLHGQTLLIANARP